ncbi:MAG: FAD-binding oxidoreductase [Chlorobi bacterium]|nr:FAD-binding oxidoreductase [Chlorobiota bacterium]
MIIKNNKDEFASYLTDAANFKGAAEAVYFPESEDDIFKLLEMSRAKKTPVTISAARTSLTGSAIPQNGIILSMEKLNKILKIDAERKKVWLQPGVTLADLHEALAERKLFYPPDPTERNCTIGGTAATNASGAKTFKYGATRAFVDSLKIILSSGRKIFIERGKIFADNGKITIPILSGGNLEIVLPDYQMPPVKNAAGYFVKKNMDAIDLFIGSEGTLGVITEIVLRVIDFPEEIVSGVVFFQNERDAFSFVEEAREQSYLSREKKTASEIDALALEFFDSGSLKFLSEDFPNIPPEAEAAVWFEQDVKLSERENITEKWFEAIELNNGDAENSWIAMSLKEREKFKNFRHAVSVKVNEYVASKGLRKVGTDAAVPDGKMRKYFYESKKIIVESGIKFIVYGHIGNSHFHFNMLPENEKEFSAAKEIYAKLCDLAVKMGGTISAEHGIGKLKRDYFLKMCGEKAIRQMAELKKQFDPFLILNPGNIFEKKYLIQI